jgi:2-polyprenyl-3-methyl-5-hydroxy-6-metoxy-1,4-benzoquinol methylase
MKKTALSISAPHPHGQILCHLCGVEMSRTAVGDTDMLLCSACGMGRVPEMKTGDFWITEDGEELDKQYWTAARSAMFHKALDHLEARGGKGKILDLGGGVGYFADCALKLGWDAYSLDISPPAQRVAARRLGGERSLSPESATEFVGRCDVVTLWCVIAHVTDPLSLVSQALDLLKPGGRLLITTPNFLFQGMLARVLARFDKPYDLVSRDHILHFTPSAIDRLLRDSGLLNWTYEYLGVTENCLLSPRFATVLVPLKRVWNYIGSRTPLIGLPPLCAELQIVGVKNPAISGQSEGPPTGT